MDAAQAATDWASCTKPPRGDLVVPDPRRSPVPAGWAVSIAAPLILEAEDWAFLDEAEARLRAMASYVESFGGDRLELGEAKQTAFVTALRDCAVEMKCDQQCRRTGFVFVEYQQRGRPSGIATSEARWYAVEVEDDVWVVLRTAALKALARQALKERGAIKGGDNENVGALVPVEWFVRRWRGVPA